MSELDPLDQVLITRSKQGDLDAFNELVLRYQDLVFGVILRMVRNHASAQDITQEAFISAFRNIGRMRGVNFRAWVLRIARNATYDAIRRSNRRSEDSIDEQIVTLGETLASGEESPEDRAMRLDLGMNINRGLGELQPDQRMAVVLVDIEGLSYDEAADAMEVSIGTVKSRLNRGRGRLREWLVANVEQLPPQFRLQQ
ncbi:MAG: sigma-70 family RNA polymerase sigma factor [Chloroflexi bacterium]|nr:sigma-70 family RNA polymerase sigma factor [Chloroflexota bacterium]